MSDRQPSVTMVVACYNHAAFVEQALTAAFAQDYPNLTVLVTDDASTDDTQSVVERVLAQRQWTAQLLFHSRNVGVCRTFNEVLDRIDTDYVCFPAGDDWSMSSRITTQVAALAKAGPNCALAYCDAVEVNDRGEPIGRRFSQVVPKSWSRRERGSLYQTLLKGNWIPAISVLARVDALRAVGGFDPSLAFEDYDMWLRLAARGYTFTSTPEPLVYLRRHSDNLMKHLRADKGERLLRSRLEIYAKQVGVDPQADLIIRRKTFSHIDSAYLHGLPPKRVSMLYAEHAARWDDARAARLAALTRVGLPAGGVRVGRRIGAALKSARKQSRRLAKRVRDGLRRGLARLKGR